MAWLNKIRDGGLWLGFYLWALSGTIIVTINAVWLYWLNVQWQDLGKLVNLSAGRLMTNYFQLLAYLNFPWIPKLKMMDFTDSTSALIHFADVKNLFMLTDVVFIITSVTTFFFWRRLKRQQQLWRFVLPMQTALWVPPVIAAVMAVNFDQFFVFFHKLLFRNNDWLFDPLYDRIIIVLPDTFFLQCFVLAILVLEGWFAMYLIIGKRALMAL
ncbi:TIGR01906 family membrane protein [Lactiplantibacillus mudanjiangensis]|uniref:TIGR01906 family membrane protein [Lactobacillus sp.] n=1 Tax=Lactiplantibacillus mudanjiangensis TaxID=1296538 RepID=A0A660E313_9LACO|nr:TIGR01906 family membrane protein [Lactiplantibacillus mudanjiangensis]VDG19266.1 TIGR01906 family membrane protein [Lactobacillus sp.] [Lactiplantibacillus mudanjiangensis]VDG26025.1 TIGR01906 family membrane protein [Lactobacillus sp.] [Lactiplantibacillus mudanjiangensis]VDG30027.1 TIGR01906 family membrane protein [Lactobacillus sp.] [Lactiplantibacillus mudanjiangensis]VDG31445.1 TIGR01906 family membrane protein [Lactobacillus sp.] [Lactiplantibacillus mudanjiangensis]